MGQYIVTITPVVGGSDTEEEVSRTTMRVFAEDGQVYIKELTVRIAENAKIVPGDLLQIDLDILAQAFAVRRPTRAGATRTYASDVAKSVEPPTTSTSAMRRGKTDRAYRRMPDQAELKATYLQSRTITGVAAHYGVPTHTAQGWISRLRRKGVIPAGK